MALRTTRGPDDDATFTEWVRVAQRIHREQLTQGSRHRVFREFRAVFAANPRLAERGGFVFNWAAQNYVDATLMLLRREMDLQAGTENLRNLLLDIIESPRVITRARYVAQWGPTHPAERDRPTSDFDTFEPRVVAGHPEQDHIDQELVQRDLDGLVGRVERVREYAERTRAHRTAEDRRPQLNDVTFQMMHNAIEDVRRVLGKYYTLLTLNCVADWEPTPQFDTIVPYTIVWAPDIDRLREALRLEHEAAGR